MGAKTAVHLLKYDIVLGTPRARVPLTVDSITVDGRASKVLHDQGSAAMPWKDPGVEVIIDSTGAFISLEDGANHLQAGARRGLSCAFTIA